MKARKPQGTAIIFLETNLEKAKPFDEKALSDIQKKVLSKLSEEEQEKIRKGYAASVVDLESGESVCKFNLEDYRPPQRSIDQLARAILPRIQDFYSKEENRKAFEEWKAEQESKK
ncbi:MAG: hypothetical protein J1F23_05420 [Oscillospiraceae bacterium]|nr:hypothetical protein [Oscillospiraceae bacterium]